MRRFTRLFHELDATTRTGEKVAALRRYFEEAPPADAVWALQFLSGRRLKRAVRTARLREWAAAESGLPEWLVAECYDAVGDLAETLALLLPPPRRRSELALSRLVDERLLPLPRADDGRRRELLIRTWRELDAPQRLVWNKLLTGGFRLGVARTLVARALAAVAGVSQAAMAHRLMGAWQPTVEDFRALLDPDEPGGDVSRPYPFFLASPLDAEPASLGDRGEWLAEWKWDGIRAQLIRRGGETLIWSRGEELVTDRFPEIVQAAGFLPDGTVLDGEILAWRDDRPLSFELLQRRIGRRRPGAGILRRAPVSFMAFDLLERDGSDLRRSPLARRRAALETIATAAPPAIRLSPRLPTRSWSGLAELREQSRSRGVEGLMLKKLDSPYRVGRTRGDWWKWKIEPYRFDGVLIYAQRGHGRRASLYTDYTFGVYDEGRLVPVAKAYSGLSDEEIRRVDAFVRRNIVERFGPVRAVRPELVFELSFEGIRRSGRHKSGLALRFPRISRWRHDKQPEDADTLAALKALLPEREDP